MWEVCSVINNCLSHACTCVAFVHGRHVRTAGCACIMRVCFCVSLSYAYRRFAGVVTDSFEFVWDMCTRLMGCTLPNTQVRLFHNLLRGSRSLTTTLRYGAHCGLRP